jgi:hypothetical protein
VVALVDHLIRVAGVRGDDILLYDATGGRNIGQPIYARIRSNPDPQFQAVKFLAGTDYNLGLQPAGLAGSRGAGFGGTRSAEERA